MALDHGILNLPLNKRGGKDIHTEIAEYRKQQRKEKAEAARVAKENYKANKAAALEAFYNVDSELLKAQSEKRGMKQREVLVVLKDMCNDKPLVALKVITDLFIAR
uniref:Uncharacterized protein n=1 Tax=Serratia proteamaculans (strain 568) TaxID=399741 RepID=A8GLP4_SERP5